MFFSIAAVISDRCVDAVAAHGCQENHQRTETIAEDANPAVALREVAHCVDGVLDVLGTGVSVINSVQTKAVLPVGLGGNTKVDARLLPPEEVWRDRKETLFRKFVAGFADVGVHPEQFLQNDNGGSRQGLRSRYIGAESAILSFDGDVILHHCALLRHCLLLRRRVSGPPPPSSESAETLLLAGRFQDGNRD